MRFLLAALTCLVATAAHAQERTARNAVHLELLGSAPVFSLNYERRLAEQTWLRAGVGYLRLVGFTETLDRFQIPLLATHFFGNGAHRLELGLGVIVGVRTEPGPRGSRVEIPAGVVIGYRYWASGGFLFRVALTPIFNFWDDNWRDVPAIPSAALGAGYAF